MTATNNIVHRCGGEILLQCRWNTDVWVRRRRPVHRIAQLRHWPRMRLRPCGTF